MSNEDDDDPALPVKKHDDHVDDDPPVVVRPTFIDQRDARKLQRKGDGLAWVASTEYVLLERYR